MANIHIGIDENGLGPQLGALIVTGVMAELNDDAALLWAKDPASFLHKRLNDSKGLVDHHDVALGEAWARVVALKMGIKASCPDDLVFGIALRDRSWLKELCPSTSISQCWSAQGEAFVASDDMCRQAQADLDKLEASGLRIRWARSAIVCTRRLNNERASGFGRFDVDLHCMEELLIAARKEADEDLNAVCGKVGGIQRYPSKMRHLTGLHSVTDESRACSTYQISGLGEVRFVRDADSADPLVALSSLIGKYIREVTMKRVVRFYTDRVSGLPNASGYNDPVTDRFVTATKEIRSSLGIEDTCFRRDQAAPK